MYQARSNGSFVRRTATNSPTFRKRVQDHIVMLLVGREATELLFGGVPASGHKKDYSDARKIIRRWLLPGADTGTRKSVIEKLRSSVSCARGWRQLMARELDLLGKLSAKEVRAIVKE